MFFTTITWANLKDSVGIKRKEGKVFVLHKVVPKETLFSLSRRYQVSIEQIQQYNPGTREGLKIADLLEIPVKDFTEKDKKGNLIHVVQPSETLFSVSRQYNVDVSDLRDWNKLSDNNIDVGQKLLILTPKQAPESNKTTIGTQNRNNQVVHTVESGQTLYSIARKYNVATEKIREWNNLPDNNIAVGQSLIVRTEQGQSVSGKDNNAGSPTSVTNKESDIEEQTSSISKKSKDKKKKRKKDEEDLAASANSTPIKPDPEVKEYKINNNPYQESNLSLKSRPKDKEVKKVIEPGIAEVIEGSENTKKYLALHKSAPVGTIMQVRNEMNDLSIFVKVIGQLPNTDENKDLIIKITKEAYDRLGALDKRFRVELSYIPQ